MAQKIQVLLVCDVHDGEVAGTETVSFSLDGSAYEIDVCAEHGAQLRDAFAPFIGAARRGVKGAAASGGGRRVRSSRSSSSDNVQEIRDWARKNGHTVSERGRLPASVVAAYEAAR